MSKRSSDRPRGLGVKRVERAASPAPATTWDDALEAALPGEPGVLRVMQQPRGAVQAERVPFPHYVCANFLHESFARALRYELFSSGRVNVGRRMNDLYAFSQSRDLSGAHDAGEGDAAMPCVVRLREALYSREFRDVMRELTGIELNDRIDLHAMRFEQHDHLLAHDDELEGRRIAFIVYLVPRDWSDEDGGALRLFGVDDSLEPTDVVKSMVPAYNSFAFFEVSQRSWHDVAEVLSADKSRLSISGWFHGEPLARREPRPVPVPYELGAPAPFVPSLSGPAAAPLAESAAAELSAADRAVLAEWLTPSYLQASTMAQIREEFGDESAIHLSKFLRKDRLLSLLHLLSRQPWTRVGQVHRGVYQSIGSRACAAQVQAADPPLPTDDDIDIQSEPPLPAVSGVVADLHRLLASGAFVRWLNAVTGLELIECGGEARRFLPTHYTLLTNFGLPASLEAVLELTPVWDEAWGGLLAYVAEGETDPLLTAEPECNRLQLVFRTPGSQGFVKYINRAATVPRYDFAFTYREAPSESGDDDDDDDGDAASN